jgi:hypothetical protein
MLSQYSDDKDVLFFKWDHLADELSSYECFLGHEHIEIAPINVPYHSVKSFHEAKHRYILSATFEDQINMIKDLGINKESIIETLIPKNRNDEGQRLILAPKRFDPNFSDEDMLSLAHYYVKAKINVVVMVPSRNRAQKWYEAGAQVVDKETIINAVGDLKNRTGCFYVLVNRYDGIDLVGNMCRILIIDGYPKHYTLKQSYLELRLDSVKSSLKSQFIEQGLGRAVRSGSDFCTIFLTGKELLGFIGQTSNIEYFTPITQEQLKLGLNLLDEESKDNSLQTIIQTSDLCLNQDASWREYHSGSLSSIFNENNG